MPRRPYIPPDVPHCPLCQRVPLRGRGCTIIGVGLVEDEERWLHRIVWSETIGIDCPGCGTGMGMMHHGLCPFDMCPQCLTPLVECGHRPLYFRSDHHAFRNDDVYDLDRGASAGTESGHASAEEAPHPGFFQRASLLAGRPLRFLQDIAYQIS